MLLAQSGWCRNDIDAERLEMAQVLGDHCQIVSLCRARNERVSHAGAVASRDCFGFKLAGQGGNRCVNWQDPIFICRVKAVHPAPETACLGGSTFPFELENAALNFMDSDDRQEKLGGLLNLVQPSNQAGCGLDARG